MSSLKELLQAADSYKEKIASAQPQAKEALKSLEERLKTGFIYSSNALEGNILTISETKSLLEGVTPDGRSLKDCYETVSCSAAYDRMLELAGQKNLEISEDTVTRLHTLFYQKIDLNLAGHYRTVPVPVSGGEYTPPSPEDIPHLMGHLADQIHSSRWALHPIELAAMAHKRLADIHPFPEGNGQIARLLMNLILIHDGYGVVSIPPARKDDYMEALCTSRRLKDMEPFSKMIAECVIEAQKDYCRLSGL